MVLNERDKMSLEVLDSGVIIAEWSSEDYHKSPDTGNSMLKTFRESRRLFEGKHITKTIPPSKSKSTDIGTVAHSAILEPHKLTTVCLEIPNKVLSKSGSRAGNNWKDFAADNAERILLKADDMRTVKAMFESVYRNPIARRLLESDGPTEESIFWECSETRLRRKCRPDKQSNIDGRWIIPDLKTTADNTPMGFARAVANFEYYCQPAYYLPGIRERHGLDVNPDWVFIAVQSAAPFVCRVWELDESAVAYGEQIVSDSLYQLAACFECDDWREPGEHEITTLSMPGWAYQTDDWR